MVSNVLVLSKLLGLVSFRVPEGPWACAQCTLINQPSAAKCILCDGPKTVSEQPLPQPTEEGKWKALCRDRRDMGNCYSFFYLFVSYLLYLLLLFVFDVITFDYLYLFIYINR